MKILHVSTPLTWRGGEQQLVYLIEELNIQGIEQLVLCAAGSEVQRYCLANGIVCETFNRINLQVLPARAIAMICKREPVSLIHTHDSHAHTAAVLAETLFGTGVPVVVSRRTNFPIGSNVFSKYKYNHPSVARVVCVSDKIRKRALTAISDAAKVVTIHSGINLSRFQGNVGDHHLLREYGHELPRPFIGNVAALTQEKDFITFVDTADAYFRMGKRGTFFIIGDGQERDAIEKYIAGKGLSDKILLTGFQRNIPEMLKQLDCFLFTSHTEGLGTSLLEAMASRVPVVATRTGGVPEVVLNGYSGLLAPVRDAEALAQCLVKVTENKELRNKLISRAYLHVFDFTKQKMASRTLSLYREVLYERAVQKSRVGLPFFIPALQLH